MQSMLGTNMVCGFRRDESQAENESTFGASFDILRESYWKRREKNLTSRENLARLPDLAARRIPSWLRGYNQVSKQHLAHGIDKGGKRQLERSTRLYQARLNKSNHTDDFSLYAKNKSLLFSDFFWLLLVYYYILVNLFPCPANVDAL